jgi:hypothetical protein
VHACNARPTSRTTKVAIGLMQNMKTEHSRRRNDNTITYFLEYKINEV